MQNDQETTASRPRGRWGRVMHAYKSVDPFAASIHQSIKNTRTGPDVQTIDDIGPPSAPSHPFSSRTHRFGYPRIIQHPTSRPVFQPILEPTTPPPSPAMQHEPTIIRPPARAVANAARLYDTPVLVEPSYHSSLGSRARSSQRRARSRRRHSPSQSRSPRYYRSRSRRRSRSRLPRYHRDSRSPPRPRSPSPLYAREAHTDEEHSSPDYAGHRSARPSLTSQYPEPPTLSAGTPSRNSPVPSIRPSVEELDLIDIESRAYSPQIIARPRIPHSLESSERIPSPAPLQVVASLRRSHDVALAQYCANNLSPVPSSLPASHTHPILSAHSDGKEDYTPEYPHNLSRASTPDPSMQTPQSGDETFELQHYARAFLVDTLPRQVYLHCLLRLPYLYFSRVDRIFQEADLTLEEIKDMALKATAEDNKTFQDHMLHLGYYQHPEATNLSPAYQRLKLGWEHFIDNLMREWKTLNIISALLLSGILTMFQIDGASSDPVTRYMAFWSLLCALLSLLYGCLFIVRFSTMRKAYKAAEWALEARKHQTVLWNVWVMLAMPVVWLAWSILTYIICIMSFMWRVRTNLPADFVFSVAPSMELGFRVFICLVLAVGGLYGILIINTFRRYGTPMDEAWKRRVTGYIAQSAFQPPYSQPPPQYYQPPIIIPAQPPGTPSNRSSTSYPLPYGANVAPNALRNSPATPSPRSPTPSRSHSLRRYGSPIAPAPYTPQKDDSRTRNQHSCSRSSPPVRLPVQDHLRSHNRFRKRDADDTRGTLPQNRDHSRSSHSVQSRVCLSSIRTTHSQDEPLPVPPRLMSTSLGLPSPGPPYTLVPLVRRATVESVSSESRGNVEDSQPAIIGDESRIPSVGEGGVTQVPSHRALKSGPNDDHSTAHIRLKRRSGE